MACIFTIEKVIDFTLDYCTNLQNMDQFLKKVNSAINFKQSIWLKPYISLITKYRAKLKMDFEKNQNKFFNDLVFDRKI